jgi:aminoglycoside phosphotransferase (APT) family kinase protein
MSEDEIALPRGDVTEGVVRVGDTVRRPHSATSDAVAAYLTHLESVGFDRAPRYLGRDDKGRDILTFLDGDVPGDADPPAWATSRPALASVARLARALHDASAGYRPDRPMRYRDPSRPPPNFPAGEPRLIAQRDITPGNTVFRSGRAWGLIDFDLSDETTRSIDLANTAMHWVPLRDPVDRRPADRAVDVGPRLRAMLDAYGRDAVPAELLLEACELRFAGGYAAMKWAAEHLGGGWARMWDDGVGDVSLRRVAWFASVRNEVASELG